VVGLLGPLGHFELPLDLESVKLAIEAVELLLELHELAPTTHPLVLRPARLLTHWPTVKNIVLVAWTTQHRCRLSADCAAHAADLWLVEVALSELRELAQTAHLLVLTPSRHLARTPAVHNLDLSAWTPEERFRLSAANDAAHLIR
jgi:hypothetical protein